MNDTGAFGFPVKDPVLVFAIILAVILIIPILLKKINIPGIIGMIAAGIALGPMGFNILSQDKSIELFGTVGLLYIMFIAGLEIDFDEFLRHKHKSLIFGAFAFLIPMIFGFAGGYYILKLDIPSSILLASMFASHTLIAYPIASKLGLAKTEAVTVTVGSTIITDIMALLVLAVIVKIKEGDLNTLFWIRMFISLVLLSGVIFLGLPRLAIWFFRNYGDDGTRQYIFTLLVLFLSAFLSELAGVEPIIGAFLSGLAVNRYIPSTSPLMNRVQFVGEAIFIPFFLISVGMRVDLSVLYSGLQSWIVAITMTVIAIGTKYIAAYLGQKALKYTPLERNVIFGLGSAQAAATLAIVIVAIRVGIFDNNILNGTIILVLVSCTISTLVVEKQGRELACVEEDKTPQVENLQEKLLIPVSDEGSIETLLDIGMILKNPETEEPIYTLKVLKQQLGQTEKHHVLSIRKQLDKAVKYASGSEEDVRVISRIDSSIADGILKAAKELVITDLLVDWRANYSSKDKIFGKILDRILNNSGIAIYVCRTTYPINTITRLNIILSRYAEHEKGFPKWAEKISKLIKQSGAKPVFYGGAQTLHSVKNILEERKPAIQAEYNTYDRLTVLRWQKKEVRKEDLFVLVSARPGTISWSRSLDRFPRRFVREFPDSNLIVLYPEQIHRQIPEAV